MIYVSSEGFLDKEEEIYSSYSCSNKSYQKETCPSDLSVQNFPLEEEGIVQLHFGREKRIGLKKTLYERHVVGERGCLLGSVSNKWMFCIPPGALDYEQELAVSFYHVTNSAGLDSNEFVTGIIEVTPHHLQFSKPVELLLWHDLCIEDDSSKVTVLYHSGERDCEVLYHSGERGCETFTSLCELSSTNRRISTMDTTAMVWDDSFIFKPLAFLSLALLVKASRPLKCGHHCLPLNVRTQNTSVFNCLLVHKHHRLMMRMQRGCRLMD